MARRQVTVSRERFRRGDFPQVCVRTGRPATRRAEFAAYRSRFGRVAEPVAESGITALIFSWPLALLEFLFRGWMTGVPTETGVLPLADGVRARLRIRTAGDMVVLRAVHPTFAAAVAASGT